MVIPFNKRELLVWYALQWLKTPYHFGTTHGGDDPMGMDCSGLVSECLQAVGLVKNGMRLSAHGWLLYFERKMDEKGEAGRRDLAYPDKVRAGDLQFFLNPTLKAYHVNIGCDEHYIVGAIGGISETTTDMKAANRNAFVKMRPVDYTVPKNIVIVDPFYILRKGENDGN